MLTLINKERNLTRVPFDSFIHSLTLRMNDVYVTDDNTYLFRDGACEKKKGKSKRKDENDDRRR